MVATRGPSSGPIAATDGELLGLFRRAGDRAALERVVSRHASMVWRVCRQALRRPEDAEDAFQATFLLLAKNARAIRASESAAGWLYRVAWRTSLRARKQLAARREEALAVDPAAPAEEAFPDLVARQNGVALLEELRALPERYQTTLVLRYFEGQSRRAIADQTDTTVATVQGRLARGKQLLRRRLLRRGVALSAAMGVVAAKPREAAAAPARLVTQTVSSGVAQATGGSVAASAATLALYHEGARAMLVALMMKPAATAAVCGLAAIVMMAPAPEGDGPSAATTLTLDPGVAADAETSTEVTTMLVTAPRDASRPPSSPLVGPAPPPQATLTGAVPPPAGAITNIDPALGAQPGDEARIEEMWRRRLRERPEEDLGSPSWREQHARYAAALAAFTYRREAVRQKQQALKRVEKQVAGSILPDRAVAEAGAALLEANAGLWAAHAEVLRLERALLARAADGNRKPAGGEGAGPPAPAARVVAAEKPAAGIAVVEGPQVLEVFEGPRGVEIFAPVAPVDQTASVDAMLERLTRARQQIVESGREQGMQMREILQQPVVSEVGERIAQLQARQRALREAHAAQLVEQAARMIAEAPPLPPTPPAPPAPPNPVAAVEPPAAPQPPPAPPAPVDRQRLLDAEAELREARAELRRERSRLQAAVRSEAELAKQRAELEKLRHELMRRLRELEADRDALQAQVDGADGRETTSLEAPQIVELVPSAGARDVDPGLREVRVTFDRDMASGMSWTGSPKTGFPPIDSEREARWIDKRTCVLPVTLVANKTYRVGINAPSFQNFRSADGVPAEVTELRFSTANLAVMAKRRERSAWPAQLSFHRPRDPNEKYYERNMAYGHSVEMLQHGLNRFPDLGTPLRVDGDYGPSTVEAVRRFQKLKDLEVTGFAGDATREALGLDDPPIARAQAVQQTGYQAGPIEEIQRRLNERVELDEPLEVDGDYGAKTAEAMRRFQKENGLRVTGTINPESLRALMAPDSE